MLITDSFVIVHVPKTGGTFLKDVCREHFGGTDLYAHTFWSQMPEESKHLPAFALVRNPWDWYVSWWAYNNSGDFPEVVKGLIDSHPVYRRFGYYNALFSGMTKGPVTIGRFESMREDFCAFLSAHGIALDPSALDGPPVRRSQRGAYASYYDDETRELVADKERPLVERFGYEF